MRPKPAAEVMGWFDRRPDASFFVSAVTRAEILLGIALLPAGKRRDGLAAAAEEMFAGDFAGRSLPFDGACANEYALIVAARSRAGRAVSTDDAQIATIGIGAGPECDGQVLVLYDMLGLYPGKKGRFVKDFMAEAQSIEGAVKNYVEAVKNGSFPAPEHCY